MNALEIFQNFLKDRGLKFTRERKTILREVSALKSHFDIEGLISGMKRKGRKVSRASIYRTVPLLVECGLLDELKTIDTHTYYEHTYGKEHHDHLICLKCGRIIEFYSRKLEKLQDEICKGEDFRGSRHLLEIQGYCRKCCDYIPAFVFPVQEDRKARQL